ncbi:MAG: hypothetical protein Q9169_007474 [Polycauliona sp. 2 TL-2023]
MMGPQGHRRGSDDRKKSSPRLDNVKNHPFLLCKLEADNEVRAESSPLSNLGVGAFYIDYQALKGLYKAAERLAAEQQKDADLTGLPKLPPLLEFSKASSFYTKKLRVFQQTATITYEIYHIKDDLALSFTSRLESLDLEAALFELRDSFRQLLWFWVINFDKTVTALGKFEHELAISDRDLALRKSSIETLCKVENLIKILSHACGQGNARHSAQLIARLPEQSAEWSSPKPSKSDLTVIECDDGPGLEQHLGRQHLDNAYGQYLISLLFHSIITGATSCTQSLLSVAKSLGSLRDSLHELISRVGRLKRLQERYVPDQKPDAVANPKIELPHIHFSIIEERLLHVIAGLDVLGHNLWMKDRLGRIPLHYAFEYDFLQVCQGILKHMSGDKDSYGTIATCPASISDYGDHTSLDLAVFRLNCEVLNILLEDRHRRLEPETKNRQHSSQAELLPGNLLMNAIELQNLSVCQLLHRSDVDLGYRDHHGNTAVHLAVRWRKVHYVEEILHLRNENLDLDACKAVYGWTSLIMASSNGDQSIVNLLLQAGADPIVKDHLGWRAKDHAAFRGWLPLATELSQLATECSDIDEQSENIQHKERHTAKPVLSSNLPERLDRKCSAATESEIYINLGALDTYKPVVAVDLSLYVKPDFYDLQRAADFTVEIRAVGDDQSIYRVQLPMLEDRANKQWRFVVQDVENFKLAFDIYHSMTSGQSRDSRIGSAVAMIHHLKQGLGLARESLIRNFTIPILHKENLDCIGTVTFYALIVTPFPHPDANRTVQRELVFPQRDGTPIIGHRGMGQNDPGSRQLQLGENTVESFLSATALGASYIEFDVQLTKDNTPIIYHDFLMSETGIDAPLHNLNLEQFLFVSQAQCAEGDPSSTAERRYLDRNGSSPAITTRRERSHSLGDYEQVRAKELINRMKHTFEYRLNEHRGFDSYKGNIRSKYIQGPLVSLEDLLVKLPDATRFDIEIKYPMLFEAHDWGMETSAVEVNHLVDNVLDRVYRLAKDRTIFFSSFSPEVCILLSRKQQIYPVYFLTEAGHIPSSDARADSLREAIWFARSWRLAGVISRSLPLVVSPHLVKRVQDAGLVCISWGELNDVPENAAIQVEAGLDAIITNQVKLIAQTLRGK